MAVETIKAQGRSPQLTIGAAARQLGLSTQRVGQLFDAGVLEGARTPYGRLIDLNSVERLAQAREAARTTDAHQ
jgi:hypothetical protein